MRTFFQRSVGKNFSYINFFPTARWKKLPLINFFPTVRWKKVLKNEMKVPFAPATVFLATLPRRRFTVGSCVEKRLAR